MSHQLFSDEFFEPKDDVGDVEDCSDSDGDDPVTNSPPREGRLLLSWKRKVDLFCRRALQIRQIDNLNRFQVDTMLNISELKPQDHVSHDGKYLKVKKRTPRGGLVTENIFTGEVKTYYGEECYMTLNNVHAEIDKVRTFDTGSEFESFFGNGFGNQVQLARPPNKYRNNG